MRLSNPQFMALQKLIDGEWGYLSVFSTHTRKSLVTRGLITTRNVLGHWYSEYRITDSGRVAYLDNRATGGS